MASLTHPLLRIQDEAHLRLLAGDQIEDREILGALRGQLKDLGALVDGMQAGGEQLPHKRRNLALAHSLARRLIHAYGGWVDEVEAELGETPGG